MSLHQSHRLLGLVFELCHRLKRPVSSKDLLHYFQHDPNARPLLLQRPGQLLFKLSRPRKRLPSRIHRLGIISNLAFYAPTLDSSWRVAFDTYRAASLIKEQCHFRMPEHVAGLLGSRFESLARNALAGFVLEFEPIYQQCHSYDSELSADFSLLLTQAKRFAAEKFHLTPPEELITREMAANLLMNSYATRMPMSDPAAMSTGRHLVHLQWPQSYFLGEPTGHYWEDQVITYCASRWPVNTAESSLARGLSLAMRYGQGPVGASLSNASRTDEGSGKLE